MNEFSQKLDMRTSKFSPRLWIVFMSFIGTLFFFLFQGGKLSFMIFIIVFVICVYLVLGKWSGIAKTRGGRTLVNAEMESILEAGTSLVVKLQIEVPGYWPMPYVLIKDRLLRRHGGEHLYESSIIPDWRRQGMVEYKTPPLRRGHYHFGLTDCSTEDIFGFFEHKGTLKLEQSFSVLPQRIAIREWKQIHHMLKGTHHHSITTRALRETTQINGVREYNYGDRLSRIHWNATARTGTLKSKEFERESLPKTIIVLDRQLSSYEDKEAFELAVSVTSSLIDYGSKHDMALGLLSVGADSVFYEPSLSQSQHKLIISHLIQVEADGFYPVAQVLRDRSRYLVPGMFIAVVSPTKGNRILPAFAWIDQRQMNPCHMWIGGNRDEVNEAWLSTLRMKGYVGYPIPTLLDLPLVLGGRG